MTIVVDAAVVTFKFNLEILISTHVRAIVVVSCGKPEDADRVYKETRTRVNHIKNSTD